MEKQIGWIVLVICAILVFPYLALSFYNHPSADDYLVTVPAIQWGPITATLGWYHSWSARFSANLILAVNPLVFHSLVGYQLLAWAILAFVCFGFWKFQAAVFPRQQPINRLSLSALCTLVYFSTNSSLVEGLYYFSGAACYQPAHALLLVLAGWVVQQKPLDSIRDWKINHFIIIGFQGGILILIAGFNEVAMAFQLALTGGLCFFYFLEKKKINLHFGLLFLASLIGVALVLFAPATFYRMEASQSFHRGLGEVLWLSFTGFFSFLGQWLKIAAFSLLLVFWVALQEEIFLPVLRRHNLVLISAFSFLLMIFCFAPSYLGEGTVQGRTANALEFFFLFLFFINALLWKKSLPGFSLIPSVALKYVPVLVAVLVLFSPNNLQAWNDLLSGEGKAFHLERMHRIHLTETATGDSVVVPPLVHRPKTIFFGDIGIFPQPWYDNFYAQYHGKKSIQLKK